MSRVEFLNIGLTGMAGAGKSTVANYLRDAGYMVRSLARPIRELLEIQDPYIWTLERGPERLSYMLKMHGGWEGIKKVPGAADDIRRMLQVTGTEWGRTTNPGIWLNVEEDALDITAPGWWSPVKPPRVVWQDIRFNNEALWVRQHSGIIIAVDRPSLVPIQGAAHSSEKGVDPRLVHHRLINTTLNELFGQVDSILSEHSYVDA